MKITDTLIFLMIIGQYYAYNTVSKGNPDRNSETFIEYYENNAENIKEFITSELSNGGKIIKI